MVRFLVNDIATVKYDEDKNIVYLTFLKKRLETKEDAILVIDEIIRNVKKDKFAVITDYTMVKYVSDKFRDVLSKYKVEKLIAVAFFMKAKPVSLTIADWFVKLHRPMYPCKYFISFEDAETWIMKQIEKNQ